MVIFLFGVVMAIYNIVVDMADAADEDYVEENNVEIVVEGDCLNPPLLPAARREPIKIIFPSPGLNTIQNDIEAYRIECLNQFTGEHSAPPVKLFVPTGQPRPISIPCCTRIVEQALGYAQCLFETMLAYPVFSVFEWDSRFTRLQFVRRMLQHAPKAFVPIFKLLIHDFIGRWHRGDLALAIAIVFDRHFNLALAAIKGEEKNRARRSMPPPPSLAITAHRMHRRNTRFGKYAKKEKKQEAEGGEVRQICEGGQGEESSDDFPSRRIRGRNAGTGKADGSALLGEEGQVGGDEGRDRTSRR